MSAWRNIGAMARRCQRQSLPSDVSTPSRSARAKMRFSTSVFSKSAARVSSTSSARAGSHAQTTVAPERLRSTVMGSSYALRGITESGFRTRW
jgi:hypothetical protein